MTWKCNICNENIECSVYTHAKDKHYYETIGFYKRVLDFIIKSIDEPLESFPSFIITKEKKSILGNKISSRIYYFWVYECENCRAKIGTTQSSEVECPFCKTKLVKREQGKGKTLSLNRKIKVNKLPNITGNPALMLKKYDL